ncbi:MAG: TonB-dependent receptor [Desulfobacteraceae bacterium]|jgi:vitamin B12 transporter|nr:TonB-dependent receptor [Desulfobacteraceae bacterium]
MMKKYYGLQLFLMVMIVGVMSPLPVESAEQENQAYELGEIVVSAPGSGAESVANVTRISAKELKDMGARTLDEGLRFVPGLNVRVGGSGTPRIDIRGFKTRHVLLLLNGVPIKNTYDDQFDPTIIPIDYIQEIKVSTGGTSQLYGSGGNGGVINIITKKSAPGVHGSISGEAAEVDAYSGRATVSAADEKYNAFVSGSLIDRRALTVSDDFEETSEQDNDLRENSDLKRGNLFAGFEYAPDEITSLGLTFNYLNGENGAPAVTNYDKNDTFAKKPKYDRTDDIEGYGTQFSFDRKLSDCLDVRGWGYYNQQDTEDNRYDDNTYTSQKKKGAYRQKATTDVAGANLQVSCNIADNQKTTLGLIMENDGWDANGFSINKKNESESFDTESDVGYYSGVLEYEAQMTDQFGMIIGAGFHTMDKDGGDNADDYSYVVGAWFDLLEGTRLTTSHSRKIRFPSIKQLYDADNGNPDLDAENTINYEVGLEQALPFQTGFSITAYRIDAKDFIERIGDDIYRNYEKYRFQGFEVGLENRMVENLNVRVAYSFLDSEDRSANTGRDQLQYRPENKFSLESTYVFPFGLTARASLLVVTDQVFYNDDTPMEKKELNDYKVVDVRLSQNVIEGFSVYMGADNLLDENYEQSYGLPQPGRTAYAGLEYTF